MIVVAGLVIWSGYTLAWWGRNRARGCTTSFRELVVPGAYVECTPGVTSGGYATSNVPGINQPPSTATGLYGPQGP